MLENLAAIQNEEGGAHIGHLFWYSISDDLYPRDLLEQTLIQTGLSTGFMPNEIRLVDAFRRATKEIECSLTPRNGVTENYMVRDVYADTHVAIRHIVKEQVDSRGKRLSYSENEGVLTLDKKDGMIQLTASPDSYAWSARCFHTMLGSNA